MAIRTNRQLSIRDKGIWYDTGSTILSEAGRIYAQARGWKSGWSVTTREPPGSHHVVARRRFRSVPVFGQVFGRRDELQPETAGFLIPPPES